MRLATLLLLLWFASTPLAGKIHPYDNTVREIRGRLFDSESKKPIADGSLMLYGSAKTTGEYVYCDGEGNFVFLIRDTGNYYLRNIYSYCSADTLRFTIMPDDTTYIKIDFYSHDEDPACTQHAHVVHYNRELYSRTGFSWGWRSMCEFNSGIRIFKMERGVSRSHTLTAGAEWNYGFKKHLLGYKVSYHYYREVFDWSGIVVGTSLGYFRDKTSGAFYLQPVLGYSVLDIIEIIAQYNVPLQENAINGRVNSFSVGLRLGN